MTTFATELPHTHGKAERTAILYGNLGTPDSPSVPDVRRFLAEFLSDPRVVEIPRWLWWPILYGLILPFRPAKSAAKYASIWTPQGSPLQVWTQRQAQLLEECLNRRGHDVMVCHAMRYGSNSVAARLDHLKAAGVSRVLVFPAYPQYSSTTTASLFDAVFEWAGRTRNMPELRFVKHYHDDPGYISALARHAVQYWQVHGRPDVLVVSFHGVPLSTLQAGDPYYCECLKTARLLAKDLGLSDDQVKVTFQSRLGRAQWLQPYTLPTIIGLAQAGIQRVDVVCPAFVCDCLETLEEINIEARAAFLQAGGRAFHYIGCLNDSVAWSGGAMADIALASMQGWPTRAKACDDDGPLAASRCAALAMGAKQ